MYVQFCLYCIFKDNANNLCKLSDLRPIIQSATLLIHKFRTKVSYYRETNCLVFKT